MDDKKSKGRAKAPVTVDERPLVKLQAERLASLTGVPAHELLGQTAAQLAAKLKWTIDPELLLYRRVCGRVVKTDASGVERPVPHATVHVEDTDCSFLGFFPVEGPWAWLFPFVRCRREEIAHAVTDACGNFCVWVPRWEIDWILRWRLERECFIEFFRRPTVGELAAGGPQPPGPGPVEVPSLAELAKGLEPQVGRAVASRLVALEAGKSFGGTTAARDQLLAAPAFPRSLPAPLDRERLQLDPRLAEQVDLARPIGPFWKCYWRAVPEWTPILDVPDITFRVTQDVDGDGTEEVIYDEGPFQVRWNAGAIPDVTLHASAIAVAGTSCETSDLPCGTPAIVLASKMPVQNPASPPLFHDAASGYALRPNQPRPSGSPIGAQSYPATAPYYGTIYLFGCNHVGGATHYRLNYTFQAPGGAVTSKVPLVNPSWTLWRWTGVLETKTVAPDANGWAPILDDADGWMPGHLLAVWPTGALGKYTLTVEFGALAGGTVNAIAGSETAPVAFQVDNTLPDARVTSIQWRALDPVPGPWTTLPIGNCPVVARPAGSRIEFQVSYQVIANHLRSYAMAASGCGPTAVITPTSPSSDLEHWHVSPSDNTAFKTVTFEVPATSPSGCYSFSLYASERAFSSDDAAGDAAAWFYNPGERYVLPVINVAVQ